MKKMEKMISDGNALLEAFPVVDAGVEPLGSRVLVQIRTPKTRTASGIIFHSESRDTEKWNTQVGKVIALGPLAFRNRDTMALWPEGYWVEPGEFIRCPKYGGDRWEVSLENNSEDNDSALFVIFNDLDIIGKVSGDPLAIKAYL
jgi:co-chaperonin GroES (HSP10)